MLIYNPSGGLPIILAMTEDSEVSINLYSNHLPNPGIGESVTKVWIFGKSCFNWFTASVIKEWPKSISAKPK